MTKSVYTSEAQPGQIRNVVHEGYHWKGVFLLGRWHLISRVGKVGDLVSLR